MQRVVKGQNIKNKTGMQPLNVPPSRGQGAHSVLKSNKSIKKLLIKLFRALGWLVGGRGLGGGRSADCQGFCARAPLCHWRLEDGNYKHMCINGASGHPSDERKEAEAERESNVQRCRREKPHESGHVHTSVEFRFALIIIFRSKGRLRSGVVSGV